MSIDELFQFHFMTNALIAGGLVAVTASAIGSMQAFALGLGFLFVSLYHGLLTGLDSLLFGTFLGITDVQVLTLLGVSVMALLVLGAIARPLLFASVDADVARASGVPVAL